MLIWFGHVGSSAVAVFSFFINILFPHIVNMFPKYFTWKVWHFSTTKAEKLDRFSVKKNYTTLNVDSVLNFSSDLNNKNIVYWGWGTKWYWFLIKSQFVQCHFLFEVTMFCAKIYPMLLNSCIYKLLKLNKKCYI